METIRILVVDDEPLGRERVRSLLEQRSEYVIVAECASGMEAIETLKSVPVDLVFLDIQMPEMSGIDLIKHVGTDSMPPVIFVTAYDQHAVEAFRLHAFDYVLKPFSIARFNEALDHAIQRLRNTNRTHSTDQMARMLKAFDASQAKKERLMIKERSKISFVQISDIDWIESAGNYVTLHVGNKQHLIRQTMTSIEDQLDSNQFMRIHRSAIVNIDRLQYLHPMASGEYQVSLTNGKKLTMSRTYKHNLERFT